MGNDIYFWDRVRKAVAAAQDTDKFSGIISMSVRFRRIGRSGTHQEFKIICLWVWEAVSWLTNKQN